MKVLARIALVGVTPVLLAGTSTDTPADAVRALAGERLLITGETVVDHYADGSELPDVDAAAWLLADLDTGSVLAARDAHIPLPPASTIKLLTAVTLLPDVDSDIAYVATFDDATVEGSRVGLVPDERYTRDDLAHGLMLASGNDAAHAIASIAAGDQHAAVAAMNAEAARLGAVTTHAETPHGLDEPGQVSSAYDLALIGRAALADDLLVELMRTPTYDFPGLDGETFQIQNQNRLLNSYDGAIGLKTGFTTEAGHTLVAAAERDGARLIVTVLDAQDGRAEPVAAQLLDWGFAAVAVAQPVGRLITPEDVDDALAAQPVNVAADPVDDSTDKASGPGIPRRGASSLAAGLSSTAITIGAGTAISAALVLLLAIRRRKRRPNGRYAA